MSTIDFELDSNLDWLECSVASVELPTTKNKASKHKSDKKFTWSAEVIEKMRVARARQIIPGMLGKTQSEETRKKISDALKGRSLTEEHKKKLIGKSKGRKPRLGILHTSESRKKMSESHKKPKKVFVTPFGTFIGKAGLVEAGLRYTEFYYKMKTNPTEYYSKIMECQE
jgi:hypothetical protein